MLYSSRCCPPPLAPAGDIVWAYDRAAGCWWPAEKLDPLTMPAGAHCCCLVFQCGCRVAAGSVCIAKPRTGTAWQLPTLAPRRSQDRCPDVRHCSALPPGRDLPAGALRALSADEKLASLPQYRQLASKVPAEQVRAAPVGGWLGVCMDGASGGRVMLTLVES